MHSYEDTWEKSKQFLKKKRRCDEHKDFPITAHNSKKGNSYKMMLPVLFSHTQECFLYMTGASTRIAKLQRRR